MRKHYTQMTKAEIAAATTLARSVQINASISHLHYRMVQKGVTLDDIRHCLQHGNVIEVHNNADHPRMLVRFKNVCVVFYLHNGNVVTVWRNANNDQHSTIDLRNYQWQDNLLPLLQRSTR